MHFGDFEGSSWSLGGGEPCTGFHGCRYRLQVLKIVLCDDGLDVGALGEVDCSLFTVAFDLNAEQPMELSKVSYLHLLGDLMLEGDNEQKCGCGDGAVVNMHNNNYGSVTIMTTVTKEHCLVHITSNKCQMLPYLHKLLVPSTTQLLQAIQGFQKVADLSS